MNIKKGINRHKFVYQFLRILIGWAVCLAAGFHYKPCKIKSKTFLLLNNHTMDIDPLLVVIGTHRHMRYVASANIMRGFGGWFVKFLAGPIPRYKGASADDTVALIKENLQAGISVAMFPEGNRSWNGETGFISRRTAKLVKESGVALVNYRTTGGYFKTPRWSKESHRKGPTYGELVREYSPQELASMSEDQIYDAICRDLYVDASEEQRKNPHSYTCKAPAECIETVLYCCPACGAIGSIHSEGDHFFCRCGLEGTIDDKGFLSGHKVPCDTIAEWDRRQKAYLIQNAEKLMNDPEPLTADAGAEVYIKENGEKRVLSMDAGVFILGDRIRVRDMNGLSEEYLLKDIVKLSAFRNTQVFFTCSNGLYVELKFHRPISGIKYYSLWRILTGRELV